LIYTVDEVSDLLSIPRPTLYRYLREYSIPHLRRSGKISIPEESFDQIREARELHKEGLGTETVRIRLREGNELGAEELAERLDQLSEGLENLQTLKSADGELAFHETLQTLLERQDLLLTAISDLTRMVEKLMVTNAHPQQTASTGLGEGTRRESYYATMASAAGTTTARALSDNSTGRGAANSATMVVEDEPTTKLFSRPTEALHLTTTRREKFGVLSRRRRMLVLVLALLAVAALVWGLLAYGGQEVEEPSSDEQRAEDDSQSVPAAAEVPQTIKAPYLLGLTLPQAEEKLAEAGLKLGDLSKTPTYDVPEGEVAVQDPQVSAEVEQGATVDIALSSGPLTYPPEVQADGPVVGGGADQYTGVEPQYSSRYVQNPDGGIQSAPFPAAPVGVAQAG
jgi:excisionase family DNA binding protein